MLRRIKDTAILYDALFSGLGILGTMGCFLNMYPLSIATFNLFYIMLMTTLFFLYVFSQKERKNLLIMISILIYILIAILTFSKWKVGILYILNTILQVYEANSQYHFNTFAVTIPTAEINRYILPTLWLIFTPMCGFITRSLRGRHSYFLAFVMSAPFIFSILLFTLAPHPTYFTMVLMFWFALLGMTFASRFDTHQVTSTIRKLGLLFGLSCLVVLWLIQLWFPQATYVRDSKIESLRIDIQTGIRNRFMQEINTEAGVMDLMSARNRVYIGSDELQVTMQEPQELYLHGFSGSIYQDNTWATPDENYFHRLYNYDRGSYVYPYNLIQRLVDTKDMQIQEKTLTLTYLADAKQYLYTPYYALGDYRKEYSLYLDAYIPIADASLKEYQLRFADQRSIIEEELEQLSETSYYTALKDMNLEISEELATVIRQLEIPKLSLSTPYEEKLQKIKEFMQGFGTYTLTPGNTPEDKDFISYFLLENQQGYCVHYASAATMILRYYGIPARYGSGFHIYMDDFENGSAMVKDYQAHAWVEVLDPVLGWLPLEVTPASTGSPINNADGVNSNPNNPSTDRPSPSQNDPTNPTHTTDTINEDTSGHTNVGYRSAPLLAVGVLVMLIASLLIRRAWIWKKRNQAMHQKNIAKAILACGTYLEQLQVKDMPKEVEDILLEAKYSNHEMNKTQWQQLMTFTYEQRYRKRKESSFLKRIVCRYFICID